MHDSSLTPEQLLAEIEELLRTMPPKATLRHETNENFSWLGRAAAAVERWNPVKGTAFSMALSQFNDRMAITSTRGLREIMVLMS